MYLVWFGSTLRCPYHFTLIHASFLLTLMRVLYSCLLILLEVAIDECVCNALLKIRSPDSGGNVEFTTKYILVGEKRGMGEGDLFRPLK
jgi:hypothetical protein